MVKCSQRGFLDLNEAGRGSPCPDCVGGGFYTFVARDGQARWTGVRIGLQAEKLWADRSFYEAGMGVALAGEVCCHWSPGSGRILPLGTFSPVGGRGGVAHHGSRGLALQYPYLNI